MRPLTGSAGYVAQNPSDPTRLPAAVAMFQIAGTWRSSLVIGSRWCVAGFTRRKSRTRCSSGLVPVSMDVHTSGESGGCSVASVPLVPSRTSRASVGIVPFLLYESSSDQSAPSRPMKITRRPPRTREARSREVSTVAGDRLPEAARLESWPRHHHAATPIASAIGTVMAMTTVRRVMATFCPKRKGASPRREAPLTNVRVIPGSEREAHAQLDAALSGEQRSLVQEIRVGCRRLGIGQRSGRRQIITGRGNAAVPIAEILEPRARWVTREVIPLIELRDGLPIEQVEDVGHQHQFSIGAKPDRIRNVHIGIPVARTSSQRPARREVVLPVLVREGVSVRIEGRS